MTTYTVRIPQLGARGPAGSQIIEKTNIAPGVEEGAIGDMALRFDDNGDVLIYGKKTSGGWPVGRSIRGPQGQSGWSPILTIEESGSSVVIRLVDWVGGTGDKPAGAGLYIGPGGLVADINDAQKIRFTPFASNVYFDPAGTNLTADDLQGATSELALLLAEMKISPAFTGIPTAPTAAPGTNTTQIATAAFVKAAIDALVGAAPATLDTLDEIAQALHDNPAQITDILTSLGNRLRIDAVQSLNTTQKEQGRSNLGVGSADKPAFAGLSVGGTLQKAPVHVGDRDVSNSVDAQILISRLITTGTGNAHAFSDSSSYQRGGDTAYNSFDARCEIDGTNNFDHYAAFQSAPVYKSTGTIQQIFGLFTALNITAGTVVNHYGIWAGNPTGAGAVTNNYGVYVAPLTKGTNANWAFYAAGTTPSYFGGGVQVGASGTLIDLIEQGIWTPTLTHTTNISASSAAFCHYERVGKRVHCWGAVTLTATAGANTTSVLSMSLPVASNLGVSVDCRGVATSANAQRGGEIRGDAANDRAILVFASEVTTEVIFSFSFDYEVI
ncbi:hypothetical protein [Borborobacter arsenicus]|uniref:hypothetical protein n=1 Tax=Borborobacter arsenicus TaxID=1851146 RepID=UPI001AEC9454|nr:hypothetical protein [Pseudaminobacter arsenicus]